MAVLPDEAFHLGSAVAAVFQLHQAVLRVCVRRAAPAQVADRAAFVEADLGLAAREDVTSTPRVVAGSGGDGGFELLELAEDILGEWVPAVAAAASE